MQIPHTFNLNLSKKESMTKLCYSRILSSTFIDEPKFDASKAGSLLLCDRFWKGTPLYVTPSHFPKNFAKKINNL